MMFIAVTSMMVPCAFSRLFSPEGILPEEQTLNLGLAGFLSHPQIQQNR